MISPLKTCLALALVATVAATSFAQDEGKKKKKGPGQPPAIAQLMKKTESLGLSDEQKTKIAAIAESYAPKLREANAKLAASLTAEQKKARQEATAKAKADGKKGKEAADAIAAAAPLTEEQKKLQADTQAQVKELTKKLNDEVLSVLTPEQKEKFQPAKKKKKPAA
jgi:Spy/CpxP family protein refolding chaperone